MNNYPASDADRAWLNTVYQTAVADVRWAKEQGWRVSQWSLALFGGVTALFKYSFQGAPVWPFRLMLGAVALTTSWYLIHLHRFGASARLKSDRVEHDLSESTRAILGNRGRDPNHTALLIGQLVLVLIACLFAMKGLSWVTSQPAH